MRHHLIWDEKKRRSNLAKHGLDFRQADTVLDSSYRLDMHEIRRDELRVKSISYALGFMAVLTVIHTRRSDATRVISFRRASTIERETYNEWLEKACERHDT